MKYVLPTCIWKYSGGFRGILRFLGISRDFVEKPEFRGSATARNIRSPEEVVTHGGLTVFVNQLFSLTKQFPGNGCSNCNK